jgi:hypothetical protein
MVSLVVCKIPNKISIQINEIENKYSIEKYLKGKL